MSGTPRMRSSFPSTPLSGNRGSPAQGTNFGSPRLPDVSKLAPASLKRQDPDGPLISFETIDAPAQRAYVVGLYTALWFWRLYDYYNLTLGEGESLWLFMKWVSIDGVFLYALPGFRIPWLEWSLVTMTVLFCGHAFLDFILMFRVRVPWAAPLFALLKIFYDSGELAISEHSVKPARIINNPSLILGRQIINILPEGSAMLNPGKIPICLDLSKPKHFPTLPIHINHTEPISIELVRFDLETAKNESVTIPVSATKKLRAVAEKVHSGSPSDPILIHWPVSHTGFYRLLRVLDETGFEVSRRSSEALVVACPTAKVLTTRPNRCRGDLSDVALEVRGTPPLSVKYHRSNNEGDKEVAYTNVQPDDFVTPLVRQNSSALVLARSPDLAWAAAYQVKVPLNETLDLGGMWTYSIEEVTDALDNKVSYVVMEEGEKARSKLPHSEASFIVHELPRLSFAGINVQQPLKVPQGKSKHLPLKFDSTGKIPIQDSEHIVEYAFTRAEALTPSGDHGVNAQAERFTISNKKKSYEVKEAGLYTLKSVSTEFCPGEIVEPASAMLINPPQPDIVVSSEPIADKCAGQAIGLKLDLDMVGTPPFLVTYEIVKNGDTRQKYVLHENFTTSRGQTELKPESAGEYKYTFTNLQDAVYDPLDLKKKNIVFEQAVRPSVSAHFSITEADRRQVRVCIDQTARFEVTLQGEGPWSLEYELIHAGRRNKKRIDNIDQDVFTVVTDKLDNGGDYTFALVSVSDKLGCKESLSEEAKIFVRHQKPKASFGGIDGKRTVRTLAGKRVELPVRLSGEPPWRVLYTDAQGRNLHKDMSRANDYIAVTEAGQYTITNVSDAVCPGEVDKVANTFDINWISRPSWAIAESPSMEKKGDTHVRNDVCEGDEDAVDITFDGRPPFFLKREVHIAFEQGPKSVHNKDMSVALHAVPVKMDTGKAGAYEYRFSQLGDENYDPDKKVGETLKISQRVNARPSASFSNPGKVYSFCQGQEGGSSEEVVPIKLQGHPPFSIDIEIKSIGKITRPIPLHFSNIESKTHDLRIPHSKLQPGNSALFIRRVRDSRGCERVLDFTPSSPRVQISVHDPPAIAPVEQRTHYCVGERVAFTLSGLAPFTVYYNFQGSALKATTTTPIFRRIAEHPGNFTITGISDDASKCRGSASITNVIHAMPSVKVSKGKESRVDIHAGGEADILFEFGGVPPFEFTYTRSENVKKGDRRGHGAVLETKTLISDEKELRIKASEEGTYEVIAIRDRYCSYARGGAEGLRVAGSSRLLKESGED